MRYRTIAEFRRAGAALPSGIVAVLLCDQPWHARSSANRLAQQGAACILAIGGVNVDDPGCPVITIDEPVAEARAHQTLSALIPALAGRWVLWLWNGEYFVFPFGETRQIGDLTDFLADERRRSIYTYALDLYAHDLPAEAEAPEQSDLNIDRIGYHAYPRDNQQLRVYGGLGWRYREFLPDSARQIGRTALFLARPDLRMGAERLMEDEEYASVSCPWHHNPTAAIMSMRRARRVMAHPEFPAVRERLLWDGSERFDWTSAQLLELGLIEPGQWF